MHSTSAQKFPKTNNSMIHISGVRVYAKRNGKRDALKGDK
jgi:hypothetical protein